VPHGKNHEPEHPRRIPENDALPTPPLFLMKRIGRIEDEAASVAKIVSPIGFAAFGALCGQASLSCFAIAPWQSQMGSASAHRSGENSSKSSRQTACGGTSMGSIV